MKTGIIITGIVILLFVGYKWRCYYINKFRNEADVGTTVKFYVGDSKEIGRIIKKELNHVTIEYSGLKGPDQFKTITGNIYPAW
jgi:hypothetical protein